MKHILAIDDEESDLLMTKLVLSRCEGAGQLDTFADVDDLLAHVAGAPHPVADLLFLDLTLPKMSGFDLLDRLLETHGSGFVKDGVVLVTASVNSDDLAKANSYDIVARYCVKPLTPEQFQDLLTD